MIQMALFNADLIRRYDSTGPRYTSYPTAVQFHEGFGQQDYREHAARSNEDLIPRPISLYFHLPFCGTVCFYCACNKIITKNRDRAVPYLSRLHLEIARHGNLYDRDRQVEQLHWGGGTPTFLNHAQMRELMAATRRHFTLRRDDEGEYSIEIDPRECQAGTLELLRELGFNRVSLGVQDIDPEVQQAVNRIQPLELTEDVMQTARYEGFRSVSVDLIYGLPRQTRESFARTLEHLLALEPDRLAIYNYAHLPSLFKTQRQIPAEELPTTAEKLAILAHAIERLTQAGYVYIGMDHFAKPEDELAVAQRNGDLYRNFQGYSTHADCDLVGLGVTAISQVGSSYSQNVRDLESYYARIDAGHLPILRGLALDEDDLLRREVISQLICHFRLDIPTFERLNGLSFQDYFAAELRRLEAMQEDSLLTLTPEKIEVLPPGRLLIRNICMAFDKYSPHRQANQRFSRLV
jgi:oxygen-independent coproporphyrinogen-3 oxidase